MERGDKVASFKIDQVTTTQILEKQSTSIAVPPTIDISNETTLHDLIEGYKPRGTIKKGSVRFQEEDD